MRIVFVGRKNFANHCFSNWLNEDHDVLAYFRADLYRYTLPYRLRWLKRRLKRDGLLRTIDQILFQVYFQLFQYPKNQELKRSSFIERFGLEYFKVSGEIPYYEFEDLNGDEALNKLRELKPDLVFAVCISQYLKEPYQTIPKYGTVLYHEGLTPEYKGLHTAFWANYNNEKDRIGYTLLQVNEEIDGGKPLAQGIANIDPELAHWWGYSGHQALVEGLPDVKKALMSIELEQPIELERKVGAECSYSYAGLTDEITRIIRTRKA